MYVAARVSLCEKGLLPGMTILISTFNFSLVPSPYFSRALRGGGKSRAWYTLSAHAPNISMNLLARDDAV